MQQLNEIFVAFAQNEVFTVFFRVLYALGVLIFFIKGEVSVSKFAQTFSNLEQRFMLSGDGKVIKKPDLDDCQAEINSHKDDCLSAFLDKYLPQLQESNPLCEVDDSEVEILRELSGVKADRILNAYEGLQKLRFKYKVPEHYSDEELIDFINDLKKKNLETFSGPAIEKLYDSQKGGKPDEKKTESQGEQA